MADVKSVYQAADKVKKDKKKKPTGKGSPMEALKAKLGRKGDSNGKWN